MARIFSDITKTIGNTPLIRLNRITKVLQNQAFPPTILVKQESRNPLGSVKDRIGVALIEAAEREGKITPQTTIIEPTSGNTGIALAFVCAAKGYRLILVMPESFSIERRKLFKALGAELILSSAAEGMTGAINLAEQMHQEHPESYLIPQQFKNPANPEIHRRTTAEEIWNDTDGQVDIVGCRSRNRGNHYRHSIGDQAPESIIQGDRSRSGRITGNFRRSERSPQDPGNQPGIHS